MNGIALRLDSAMLTLAVVPNRDVTVAVVTKRGAAVPRVGVEIHWASCRWV